MVVLCAHCELPTTPARGRGEDEVYCCVGCRIAAMASDGRGARGLLEARLVFAAFLTMGVMTFTTLLYGHDLLADGGETGLALVRDAGRLALVFFALPVLALLAPPLADGAWRDARQGHLRMDGLIVVAVSAAFALSLTNTWRGTGEVYFESATMVLVLVTLGRRLEARAREAGRDAAEAVARELPESAHRVDDQGTTDVALDELRIGDVCDVHPGETTPADGIVVEGRGTLIAAHLTGESVPRAVEPGDTVVAGAVNGASTLRVRITAPWTDGPLGRIRDLLASPLGLSPRQRRIDRVARALAAVAITVAVVAATIQGQRHGIGAGLSVALSVLLVACPCALGLAVPLADRAMRVALARHGLLVRDGAALETIPHCDRVVFDKTGTLTQTHGRWTTAFGNAHHVRDVATLIAHSGHVLAQSVPATLRREQADLEDVESIPGCGVIGRIDGKRVMAGQRDWVDAEFDDDAAAALHALAAAPSTVIVGAVDGAVVAVISVDHPLRATAVRTVRSLGERGLTASLLSGDRKASVDAVAASLGLASRSQCSPDDKLETVRAMQAAGHRIIMVGDGVNDAPVLRAADVGVAMGSGTAAARLGADVEILGDDLQLLDDLVEAAGTLTRSVRGNLAWTIAYNAVALTAAATGQLSPPLAAAAMIVSSAVVAWRSGRLLGWTAARTTHDVAPAPAARLEPVTP